MLIYDANKRVKNPNEALPMEAYMKGVYDAAEFKEEDHPRGGKGSESGGKFVKSEKTKRKEDEVDDLGNSDSGKTSAIGLIDKKIKTAEENLTESAKKGNQREARYWDSYKALMKDMKEGIEKHNGSIKEYLEGERDKKKDLCGKATSRGSHEEANFYYNQSEIINGLLKDI